MPTQWAKSQISGSSPSLQYFVQVNTVWAAPSYFSSWIYWLWVAISASFHSQGVTVGKYTVYCTAQMWSNCWHTVWWVSLQSFTALLSLFSYESSHFRVHVFLVTGLRMVKRLFIHPDLLRVSLSNGYPVTEGAWHFFFLPFIGTGKVGGKSEIWCETNILG